jgi:hypothetical protein
VYTEGVSKALAGWDVRYRYRWVTTYRARLTGLYWSKCEWCGNHLLDQQPDAAFLREHDHEKQGVLFTQFSPRMAQLVFDAEWP